MTIADGGLWIATVAAVFAAVCAGLTYHRQKIAAKSKGQGSGKSSSEGREYPRWSFAPLAAALVAWAAVLLGYFSQLWLPLNKIDFFEWTLVGKPLGWETFLSGRAKPIHVTSITTIGRNLSKEAIRLDDAYVISEVTGERRGLTVSLAGNSYPIEEINPIPGRALFILSSTFEPPLTDELSVKNWSTINLAVKYNGKEHIYKFNEKMSDTTLPRILRPLPQVVPRK